MPTACTPLPSPDDPSLNALTICYNPNPSPNSNLPSLDDPSLSEPTILARDLWPDSPEGRIAALLPEDRGHKLCSCRKGGFIFRYADGSRAWRPMYPCNLTIACAACALDQAAEQFSKYAGLATFIPGQLFTRMTIPLDPSLAVKDSFDACAKACAKAFPKVPVLAKIKPSTDSVEILACGELPPESLSTLSQQFPGSRIRSRQLSTFSRELHRVLDADLLATPEATAYADAKYRDIRLLRVFGISQENRKKLSLMGAKRDNFMMSDELGDESSDEITSQSGNCTGYDGQEGQSDSQSGPPVAVSPSPSPSHFHRTASGRLMPLPSCPCGCGAAPTHFGRGKSINDDSPDINWTLVELAQVQ